MAKKDKRGGRRDGAGRPAVLGLEKRKAVVAAKVTVDEWNYILKAAEKQGLTVSNWLRRIAIIEAEKINQQRLLKF